MNLTDQQKEEILTNLRPCMDDAEQYYKSHLLPKYTDRTNYIDASPEFYNKKFPSLSKIPLTTSEIYDTINWMMPSLVDTFSSSDDVVTIQGENGEDDARADKVQKLINYQTERLNDGFLNRYHWMKSSLEMNIGFMKISWQREERTEENAGVFNDMELQGLTADQNISLTKQEVLAEGDGYEIPSIISAEYQQTIVEKNQPLIEVLPVTEVRWASDTKRLKDATFVEHVKTVTLNDLLQKEREGVYFDIAKVKELGATSEKDSLEQKQREYVKDVNYSTDDLRRPITIHECYILYDLKGEEKLSPYIFTVAEKSVLIGAQENTMERHPIFEICPMPDAFNVVPRKGLVELLAEIQHINTALIRLFVRHLIKANEGRRFVDKNKVDQDDLLNEAQDVGCDGDPRAAVYAMPFAQMSPMTMPFFQMMQSKIESTVGVTKYNTGTDAANLNPTATGVTALIDQANKKIKLIAQIFATYYAEVYRFLISLNQKYIDQAQVIRLLNEEIEITPDDLDGKLDLLVNTGMSSANKNQEIQNTQLIIATLEKIGTQYPGSVTYDKAFNVVKLLLEQLGRKDVDTYVNSPEFQTEIQRLMTENAQLKQALDVMGGAMHGVNGGQGQPPNPAQPDIPGGGAGAGIPQPNNPNPAAGML